MTVYPADWGSGPARHDIPGGFILTHRWQLPAGELEVREFFQTIYDRTEAVASWCTLREAWLGGELILDPARAQALCAEALALPDRRSPLGR